MKIKNSSRITALILTLVMILPLISLPTFAEEVKTPVGEVLYSNDFEQYTAGQAPTAGDFTTLPSSTKAEKMDGDIALKLDWTGVKNEGNINANLILKTPAISHEDHSVITVEADYWFSTDATGKITVQFRKFVSTQNTSETWWLNLCDIAADGTLAPSAGINKVAKITKGAWNNVKLVINLKTGSVNFFVNDEFVTYGFATNGATPQTNIKLTAAELIIAKPATTAEGSFAVDNVKITSGTTGLATRVWSEDFESFTVGQKLQTSDMGNKNAGYNLIPSTATIAQDGSKALKLGTSLQGKTDVYFVGTAVNDKGQASSTGGSKKNVASYELGNDGKPTKVTIGTTEYTVSELSTACPNADKRKTGVVIDGTNYYLFNAQEWEFYYGGDVVDRMILAKNPEISYANFDSVVFELKYYISADFKADMELQFYKTNNGGYKAFYSVYGYNELVYLNVDGDKSAPLNRGAWNTVSMVLNLDTGKYNVYVNGRLASDTTKDLPGPATDWSITANCWSLAKVSKSKCTADSGYIMIDDLCIYEGTAPRKATTDIYYNGFEQYEAGKAVPQDGYINYALANQDATKAGTIYEKTPTIDNTLGSNALKLFYQSTKDSNDANRVGYNMDKNFKLTTPKLSYTEMESVVFDFNVFIPATSSGAIHVRYGNAYASGDYYYKQGAENVIIKDGEGNAKAVNNERQDWTPDLFRLEYYTAGQDAIFSGKHNALEPTAKVKVNEWATLSVVVNLKDGTITGYANGVLVYSGSIRFQKSLQDRTVDGNLGYSATNPDNEKQTITVYEYTVEGNKVYKTSAGVEIDAKWLQYNAKVSGKDVAVLKVVEGETVTYEKPDGTAVKPDDGTTPTMKVANVWYWVKNPTNVTLNANQLCITGFGNYKATKGISGDLLIDDIAIYEGNAPKNAIYKAEDFAGIVNTEEAVQIRLAENSGLRFATAINTELLAKLQALAGVKEVKIGTLIAPERYLTDGTELTVESLTRAAQKMLKVEADVDNYYQGYDNDETTTHFVGSIVDILASNIGQDFCARGYVEVVMESGQSVYIYSADYATRNVQEAATAIIAEVGAENLDEVYGAYAQILRNYAAGLQADAE